MHAPSPDSAAFGGRADAPSSTTPRCSSPPSALTAPIASLSPSYSSGPPTAYGEPGTVAAASQLRAKGGRALSADDDGCRGGLLGGDEAWRAQEPQNAHSHLLSMLLGNRY
jgi:hypothetical protein